MKNPVTIYIANAAALCSDTTVAGEGGLGLQTVEAGETETNESYYSPAPLALNTVGLRRHHSSRHATERTRFQHNEGVRAAFNMHGERPPRQVLERRH